MACGCPVIAADTTSLPEVVGDAGILINPTDTGKLENAIFNLLNDNNLKIRLIREGLLRSKAFKWNESAVKTFKIYSDIKK